MAKTREEIEELKHEYEMLTSKLSELAQDELIQVLGGEEGPKEFDWRGSGYQTPIKHDEQTDDSRWEFSAIGNIDGQYFKRYKERKKPWDIFNKK